MTKRTVSQERIDRNKSIVKDWAKLYTIGMKKEFVHAQLATKYGLGIRAISKIIQLSK